MAAIAEGLLLLDTGRCHDVPAMLAYERRIRLSLVIEAFSPCCLKRLDGVSNKRLGLEFACASACLEEDAFGEQLLGVASFLQATTLMNLMNFNQFQAI